MSPCRLLTREGGDTERAVPTVIISVQCGHSTHLHHVALCSYQPSNVEHQSGSLCVCVCVYVCVRAHVCVCVPLYVRVPVEPTTYLFFSVEVETSGSRPSHFIRCSITHIVLIPFHHHIGWHSYSCCQVRPPPHTISTTHISTLQR